MVAYRVVEALAPFPWDPDESEHHEERLRNLRALVARARKHEVGVYLYLNEPRTQSLAFFEGVAMLLTVVFWLALAGTFGGGA